MINDFSVIEKEVRAQAVRYYMAVNGYDRAVCFSCGHAYEALQKAGVPVVGVAPGADLMPCRWFTPKDIRRTFPGLFDATSGHLPLELMYDIADRLRQHINLRTGRTYEVASGSGETALCLKLAYPAADIVPVFDNSRPETEWNDENFLNRLLITFFPVIKRL